MRGTREIFFKGISVGEGVARGPVFILRAQEFPVSSYKVPPDQLNSELKRFERAINKSRQQLAKIRAHTKLQLDEKNAKIFDAHLLILQDPLLKKETIDYLKKNLTNIEFAFYKVTDRYINSFLKSRDKLIRDRTIDIKDLARRVLQNLAQGKKKSFTPKETPAVWVVKELSPSQAAILNPKSVLAIVTEKGSLTSHSSIIARSLGIPMIVGVKNICTHAKQGREIIVDTKKGRVVLHPSPQTIKNFSSENFVPATTLSTRFPKNKKTQSSDGERIVLLANINSADEAALALKNGAEGVGLFRTEFLFLGRQEFFGEEEQLKVYKKVLKIFRKKPVTIRTFDFGGDKSFNDLYHRDNKKTFKNLRGIQFSLKNPKVFKTQLKALLRASVNGNLRILFPMINNAQELLEAKKVLAEAAAELKKQRIPFKKNIPIGAMIETKIAAKNVDSIAPHCHFLSIGTNDLVESVFPGTRDNSAKSRLYNPFCNSHATVVRLIKKVVQASTRQRIDLLVCGEIAADTFYLPMLLGLGIKSLSMNSISLNKIKEAVRSFSVSEFEREVEEFLKSGRKNMTDVLDSIRIK